MHAHTSYLCLITDIYQTSWYNHTCTVEFTSASGTLVLTSIKNLARLEKMSSFCSVVLSVRVYAETTSLVKCSQIRSAK